MLTCTTGGLVDRQYWETVLLFSNDLLVFGIDKNDHHNRFQAAIAQLGERQTEDLEVPGSIPGRGICFNTEQCGFRKSNS